MDEVYVVPKIKARNYGPFGVLTNYLNQNNSYSSIWQSSAKIMPMITELIPAKGLPITTYWRLIWLRDKKLSPIAANYLEYVRAKKQKIIEQHFQWYQALLLESSFRQKVV